MRELVVVVVAGFGCGTDDISAQSPRDEYYALEARIATECGDYERNYPSDVYPPTHLCGAEPNIGCVNSAIGGAAVVHLQYSFIDPLRLVAREQNYYAADGKVVWIGYYDTNTFQPARWYRGDCTTVVAERYDVTGTTCWKLTAADCVAR